MQSDISKLSDHPVASDHAWTLAPTGTWRESGCCAKPISISKTSPKQLGISHLGKLPCHRQPSTCRSAGTGYRLGGQALLPVRASGADHGGRYPDGAGADSGSSVQGRLADRWRTLQGNASHWLSLKPSNFPSIVVEHEIERGAAYCTQNGNTWFGTWLMEDCPTYALACNEGVPITTAPSARYPLFTQGPAYEQWLGMQPLRLRSAFFHELVLFDDVSNNRSRHLRYRAMGDKLLSHVDATPHPGVFILRGSDGDLRLLRNELEIAEHLRKHRGFRVINPMQSDVPSIVAACAGARTVIGVEGSQLVHGVNVLQTGGNLLVLQPPNRFVSYYKYLTDRDGQHFAFVVGMPQGDGFTVDIDEVERTLDLLPS